MEWSESEYSEQTAYRLARAGALVRIDAAEDACEVCRARARDTYTPSDVPRLPIRGCTRGHCRCRFVAVDPETELTVPQMVQRGVYALRAGRTEVARQVLRRAVALDDRSEVGWLWLSAVAEGQEQITCLQKVLEINPGNQRAQEGLRQLREEQRAPVPPPVPQPEPASAHPRPAGADEEPIPEPVRAEPVTGPEALPLETIEVREERKVILEQWSDFLSIAVETDPQMVSLQGRAFLKTLARLNGRALETIPAGIRLDELQLQWEESEILGKALADLVEAHQSRRSDAPDWHAMYEAMRGLAQGLLDHRDALRKQIAAAGEGVSTE